MSKPGVPLQLIQLPPPEEGERRHTYGAMDDSQGLRLLEPSPTCPCAECVWLRAKQNKERNTP